MNAMDLYWKSSGIKKIRMIADILLMFFSFYFVYRNNPGGYLQAELLPAAFFIVFSIVFLSGFEVYSVLPLTTAEITISISLGSFYSCIVMIFSALLLRAMGVVTAMKLVNMALCAIISLCLLMAIHLLYKFYLEHRKNKPRLLMIDKSGGNFARLKRLRYATTKAYDTWYEQIDTENSDSVQRSIAELLPRYDSVCLLEGIDIDAQRNYIQAAMELKIELFVVPSLFDMIYSKINLVRFDDVLGFHMHPHQLSASQAFVKRALDIVASIAMLIVAFVPMVVIALLVRLTSPGPVFYSQERITMNRRVFRIHKFRTMVVNAEQLSGPVFSTKNDPRITLVGNFLRKTRLDELPQMINVLLGDMSLVGPRPERPFFVEQFEQEIDNYSHRCYVRAGLTSLSHVYGRYSTDIKDRTRYDLLYVSNYSLSLDLKVLLQTSRIVFLPSASEGVEINVSSNSVELDENAIH